MALEKSHRTSFLTASLKGFFETFRQTGDSWKVPFFEVLRGGTPKSSKNVVWEGGQTPFSAETARSGYGGTFCGYPVSKCHRTLWVDEKRVLTQLRLLIYCLIYGPLKTGFWTPKIRVLGGTPLFWGSDPYFGDIHNDPPPNRHFGGRLGFWGWHPRIGGSPKTEVPDKWLVPKFLSGVNGRSKTWRHDFWSPTQAGRTPKKSCRVVP